MNEIVHRVRAAQDQFLNEEDFAALRHDLTALRQSILKAAFEGRLVAQHAADEPASVLLDRLRRNAAGSGTPRRETPKSIDKLAII